MDIQGWLQGTADRAPPNQSDEVDASAFGPPTQIIEATNSKRYHRKRKRAASDSSVISLQQRVEQRGKADDRSADAARVRPVDVRVTQSPSASRHRRPRSQEHGSDGRAQAPDQKAYNRRARRKTKADRYEPKKQDARERKQSDDDAGKRISKRKRKRAHRSGDGKHTESLVQGFKLKNRLPNSRLTLKPDNTAGLFKHGRASAQMAGRQNGLPDLVFNELKFLRDFHEHQDERPPDSKDHRPNVQDKKREFEREEISAYFNRRTSRDPALDPPLVRRTETKRKPRDDDGEHNDLSEGGSSPMLPNEELTAIPYLGFGSKGATIQSGDPHPSATIYLAWSESAAGSDRQKKRTTNVRPTGDSHQTSTAKKAQKRRLERDSTPRASSGPARPLIRKDLPDVPKGQWSTSRRTRGPAKVEVYIQQSSAEPDQATSKRKLHDNTSVSLPTRPPAGPSLQRRQKTVIQQQVLPSDVESFNTSDILKVKGRLESLAKEAPASAKITRRPQSDKENVQPISSSPTAKIIRIAHDAMAKGYEEPTCVSRSLGRRVDESERGHNSYASENEAPGSNRPRSRHLGGYRFAYQPRQTHAMMQAEGFYQQVQLDLEIAPDVGFDPEDNEMLDGHTTYEPTFRDYADAAPDYVQTHMYTQPATHTYQHSLSFRYDRPSTRARDDLWSRDALSAIHRDRSSHVATAEQGLPNEEDHIGDRDFEDGLEGFWRPNRLY